MLSTEQTEAIAARIGLDADALAQAISDEQEAKLELPEGRFLTKDNEAKLLDNHGKTRYDAGVSKTLKSVFDGKDKDTFLNEYKSTILEEAKLEPNGKITELQSSLDAIRGKYEEDKGVWESEKTELNNKLKGIETRATAISAIPDLRGDTGLSKQDALNLFFTNHKITEEGVEKNGKLLKTDMQDNVSLESALKSFVEEKGWIAKEVKGNGGNKTFSNGTPKTYDEYKKVLQSKGWTEASMEAREYLAEVMKKNPKFEM